MSITLIRQALATNIGSIAGLRTAAEIPDNPAPPIAVVSLSSVEYDGAFDRGLTRYNFLVTVIVGRAAERTAQRRLDAFISTGASSVKFALELDKTLGGNAFDCRVTTMNSVGSLLINETTYLAADFSVSVIAN